MLLVELEGIKLSKVFFLTILIFRFLPYIGMVTIVMNDYPQLKYFVLATLGFFVLVHREN